MVRVVGIDHLVIRVSDYERSKDFYGRLFAFLGFEISDEYEDAIGWTNGKTRFWIGPADAEGRERKYRVGDVGFHHYAFQLRSRRISRWSSPKMAAYAASRPTKSNVVSAA